MRDQAGDERNEGVRVQLRSMRRGMTYVPDCFPLLGLIHSPPQDLEIKA